MYIVLIIISIVLITFYVIVIGYCLTVWEKIPVWEVPTGYAAVTSISVIVPARNEAAGILETLQSLVNQSYPRHLFEIIVIDDHSTDATPDLVQSLNNPQIKFFHLREYLQGQQANAYKKLALGLGIQKAKGELIVTTDADCLAPTNWLLLIASYYEKNPCKFIAAPVNFFQEKNLLEKFQSLDFMGMMLLTGAGIRTGLFHMCNGANLAYPKQVFEEVNGFQGIDHLASGDDLLLLHKIAARYPGEIGFIKNVEATVCTQAKATWTSFLQQRLRWATKSSSYQEWQLTFILAMVFFLCVGIVVSGVASFFLSWSFFMCFLILFLLKSLADYFFLNRAAHFFQRDDLMSAFWVAQFLHIFYIVVIGIWSNLVKQYEWKGRKVR